MLAIWGLLALVAWCCFGFDFTDFACCLLLVLSWGVLWMATAGLGFVYL